MLKFANGERYYEIDSDSDNSIADETRNKSSERNEAVDYAMPLITLDSPPPAAGQEDGNQEQQMDALFRDVTTVQETLLAKYPGMNVDPNVIFEQLEVCRGEENRKDKVVKFLGALEQTYRSQAVDFRMNADTANNGGNNGAATAEGAAAAAIPDGTGTGADNQVDEDIIDAVAAGRLGTDGPPALPLDQWEWRNGVDHRPPPEPPEDIYEGLMRDVQSIMDMFPAVDPTEAYAHLEARRHERDRIQHVVDELLHGIPHAVAEPDQHSSLGGANNHWPWPPYGPPPEHHQQQQQHHQQQAAAGIDVDVTPANRKRGVDTGETDLSPSPSKMLRLGAPTAATTSAAEGVAPVAVNGEALLIGAETANQPVTEAPTVHGGARPKVRPVGVVAPTEPEAGGSSNAGEQVDEWVEEQVQSLMDTFPDADPDWVRATVRECHCDEEKLQEKVTGMVEDHRYPKLRDREERLERERKKAYVQEMSIRTFTVDDIMQWVENPLEYFYDQTKPVSNQYRALARSHLMNEFLRLTVAEIDAILLSTNYHYAPAVRAAKELIKKGRRRKRVRKNVFGGEPEELFFKELAFTKVEQEIRDNIEAKSRERERRIEIGRREGNLITCLCCYDEDGLPDEMVDCDRGHMFCKTCVVRGVDVAFGQGKTHFDCMAENCKETFSLQMLKAALPPKVFSNWLRKIQEDEIHKADIPDLVQCPFCSFAAIVENPDDKVFHCLDPECLKESCRLCREVSHIPLRCDEVEKELEVKLRTAIENEMTEALLRKCNKCFRSFVKQDGCNKMTCPCGAHYCYVCKQPISGYDHFGEGPGRCPQMNDTAQMLHNELTAAAKVARDAVIEKHPELRDVEMKHGDPTKDLPKPPPAPPAALGLRAAVMQVMHDRHGHARHIGIRNLFVAAGMNEVGQRIIPQHLRYGPHVIPGDLHRALAPPAAGPARFVQHQDGFVAVQAPLAAAANAVGGHANPGANAAEVVNVANAAVAAAPALAVPQPAPPVAGNQGEDYDFPNLFQYDFFPNELPQQHIRFVEHHDFENDLFL